VWCKSGSGALPRDGPPYRTVHLAGRSATSSPLLLKLMVHLESTCSIWLHFRDDQRKASGCGGPFWWGGLHVLIVLVFPRGCSCSISFNKRSLPDGSSRASCRYRPQSPIVRGSVSSGHTGGLTPLNKRVGPVQRSFSEASASQQVAWIN
jgi:hypothetical protein